MRKISASNYVETMKPWLTKLPEYLRHPAGRPDLVFYGTGESAHWPTQSNLNVSAALAVLSRAPELEEAQRDEAGRTALALLRYAMATHLTGDFPATDGRRWGCHWISVLGLERMSHGLNAIRDRLTEEDNARLRRLVLCESDWLLDHYPVDRLMHDVALALLAVQTQTTSILNDFPTTPAATQAEKNPA